MVVHVNSYTLPATPLNTVVSLVGSTKLPPAPLVTVHFPVPTVGPVAARVALVPQTTSSPPAEAAVGKASLRRVISLVEGVHEPLVIVQRTTTDDPTDTPVIVLVGEFGEVTVAGPVTTLQVPVPV